MISLLPKPVYVLREEKIKPPITHLNYLVEWSVARTGVGYSGFSKKSQSIIRDAVEMEIKLLIKNECIMRQPTMICFHCLLRYNTGNHAEVKICTCCSKPINREESVAYMMKGFRKRKNYKDSSAMQ
jgi:hypothetical protein